MRHLMDDERIIVHMLLFVGNHTAAAGTFSTFTAKNKVQLVARDTIMQRNDIMVDTTVGLLVDIDVADADILGMRLLHTIEV